MGRFAEFGDVGACDKGLARTAQHDGLDRIIGQCFFNAILQTLTDMPAECIDRRIVDENDKDVAMTFGGYGLHFSSFLLPSRRREGDIC